MTNALLTDANPGGLNLTIATFTYGGVGDTLLVKLMHSVNTAKFFTLPNPGAGYTLTDTQIATLKGYRWTQVELALSGDFAGTFTGLARAHVATLASQGRATQLTTASLFNWLTTIWPSIKTYFIDSSLKSNPFTISLVCPQDAPPALVVNYPDNVSLDKPASIPRLQVYAPAEIPFSSIPLADQSTAHLYHAYAAINYPTPGTHVISGTPLMLIADPGLQVTTSHSFTWYSPGAPAQRGPQVSTAFYAFGSSVCVPITLLVTNLATGISDATVSYLIVDP